MADTCVFCGATPATNKYQIYNRKLQKMTVMLLCDKCWEGVQKSST